MKQTPQFFTKVTTNAHHELFIWANKKPLRWAILMTISSRVASKDQITTGLHKGEFFFSETEYEKFGVEKSKQGNIRRILHELITFGIVKKVENKKGNKNCNVYCFIDSDFMDCSRLEKEQNRELIENKERTNRELIETNKECKNDKNDKNDKKDSFVETSEEVRLANFLFEKIKESNPYVKPPNIQKWAKHIDLMYRMDKIPYERIEKMIEWCKQDSFWNKNILSTDNLRKHFPKMYESAKSDYLKQKQEQEEKENRSFTIQI
jgi:hypothetical protein